MHTWARMISKQAPVDKKVERQPVSFIIKHDAAVCIALMSRLLKALIA